MEAAGARAVRGRSRAGRRLCLLGVVLVGLPWIYPHFRHVRPASLDACSLVVTFRALFLTAFLQAFSVILGLFALAASLTARLAAVAMTVDVDSSPEPDRVGAAGPC